jgi:hypothetical protein
MENPGGGVKLKWTETLDTANSILVIRGYDCKPLNTSHRWE